MKILVCVGAECSNALREAQTSLFELRAEVKGKSRTAPATWESLMLRLGIPAFVVKARGAAIEDLETCGFLAAHDAPYPHWNNRLPLDGSSGQRALHVLACSNEGPGVREASAGPTTLPNPCPRAITPPAAAALSPLRRLRARARARARTQRTRIHVAHSARTRLRHLPPSSVDSTTPLRRTRQPRPARQLAHTPLYSLTNLLVWTTTVCLWLMWVITYCMQMNPLIEPIPKVFGGSE